MLKHSLLSLLILPCLHLVHAQSYNLASVPDSLKKNADVIMHLDNTIVEIEDVDKATVKSKKIFTVMNEEGKEALWFHQYSSRAKVLEDAEIKVYDQNGKQKARYKKKDMSTIAIGEGLIDDGYTTYFRIPTPTYPVTVEFDYEFRLKSILNIPSFYFMGDSKEAVVESSYSIKFPVAINVRYKPKLTAIKPEVADDGKYKTYKWIVKNLPVTEEEEGTAGDQYPHIDFAADQFDYLGNKGDLSSWKNFGMWINNLYQGLDELPADRKQFFQAMVKDAPNDAEKARRIYQYLQENFRYVSIQLGIGGYKPFSATFTDQKKYGDCKALSNYMKAALKAVGIRSHVAIINAEYNEEPVDVDFPANQFNHVILCVPQPKDSIWLECTSSIIEFAKLSTSTENRNALLITEDGGVMVPTPLSKASDNTLTTRTTVVMDNDLYGTAETIFTTTGAYKSIITELLKDKRDDQKEFIVRSMGYKEPVDFALEKAAGDQHTKMKMEIRKVPEFVAGDNYFVKPRINKLVAMPLPTANNRKLDFYFRFPFEERDTTIIKFPSNYHPDVLPKEKILSTNYSYYQSKSWFNEKENAIYTSTTFILKQHKIPARDYASVKNFFDEVAKDDAQRIVVKKTGAGESEKKAF